MMNGAWVALMVLACAGMSGGDDVRAAERTTVPDQVSAERATIEPQVAGDDVASAEKARDDGWRDEAWTGERQETVGEGKGAAKGESKASEGKTADGASAQVRAGRGKAGQRQVGDGAALIDVNKASAEQLEALPGIGASMASRIVEYRQKHGPFKRLDDLMNVRGIGEKNFLKLKPLITIGSGGADQKGTDQKGTEPKGTDRAGSSEP